MSGGILTNFVYRNVGDILEINEHNSLEKQGKDVSPYSDLLDVA
jgi:hypothetical protein